jgi:oligoendopeptidase F
MIHSKKKGEMMLLRSEVATQDQWKVEDLFPTIQDWEKELKKVVPAQTSPFFPQISEWKGKLNTGSYAIHSTLITLFDLSRKLDRLFTYAHLRHDEDISNETYKVAFNRILTVSHHFQQEISWFEPEIVSLPQELIDQYLQDPILKNYRFYLEKIIRMKPHTLNGEGEHLIALAAKAMQTPQKAFSSINNADFDFGKVLDSAGKEHPLTHASYSNYLRSHDPILRKNTFEKLHQTFKGFQNTLTELLSGQVEAHLFFAKSHKFKSCLEASLFPKNIDTSVYHSLVDAANDELSVLHNYISLRKKVLGQEEINLWDMYVPLTKELDIKLSYEEAEAVVIESVAPLGQEYQDLLAEGLLKNRWVDRYENKNKRSGAYSSGCYDSHPYILMNYKDSLRDVFTLAHEAGHSMHSLLSHKNQPYQDSQYPIFLAEVASTFNEELLTRHLLAKAKTVDEKIFLINQKIEDIRLTFFRQTMFAEFELKLHQFAEEGTPITPELLNAEYHKLNVKYFGPAAKIHSVGDIEWARIPHFYYNFYVYQYATGISAALALTDHVVHGGEKERQAYLNFLKGGCSKYPIDLLKGAGVDMRTKKPVQATLSKFKTLVSSLEELLA